MHPSRLPTEQLLAQCSVRHTKRSGPGGQHRNKVETAVVIEHQPSGCISEASESRSQSKNRACAVFRLRLLLAVEYQQADVCDFAPSELWTNRCRNGKLSISSQHDEYPALLAELMECLRHFDHSLQAVAAHKRVSSSQLVNLLRLHPPALISVNRFRESMSLRKLT